MSPVIYTLFFYTAPVEINADLSGLVLANESWMQQLHI